MAICPTNLERAAELIRAGELVAFPTETVYGLGANAFDEAAVNRIFEAKGRPATSPLIVHVASIEMARSLAAEWPEKAQRLAERFWPGPLTLVVRKQASIPGRVTAGLGTVGLRMPANRVALELIERAGVPIAAPSANRFTELSPTTAEHVRRSLGDRVALILDGGATEVGIESTVLSLAGGAAVLLRPGMIRVAAIEGVIGAVSKAEDPAAGAHSSPGQHAKHYSPRTPLLLVEAAPAGERIGYVWIRRARAAAGVSVRMPEDPSGYAARLFAVLHDLDEAGLEAIAVELPPREEAWAGIHDRLRRAANL